MGCNIAYAGMPQQGTMHGSITFVEVIPLHHGTVQSNIVWQSRSHRK